MSYVFDVITEGLKQLSKGGILMIPLLICSIISHAIIFERLYNLRKSKLMPQRFISRIYRVLEKGNPDIALSLCESHPGPLTNILKAGILNRNLDEKDLKVVIDFAARPEKKRLEKFLRVLAFLGGVSVLIGLLGTVSGMFMSFTFVFKSSSSGATSAVAKGISVALLTTVAGLAVALPSMIAYAYFISKVDNIINDMTRHSVSLVRYLTTGRSRLIEHQAEQSED